MPAHLVRLVDTRAAGRCEYCHAPRALVGQAFHVDHIMPRVADGRTVAENLCLACSHCNAAKASRTRWIDYRTGRIIPIFNPRVQRWHAHFRLSSDGTRIIGRTPVGRASVKILDMNSELLRDARLFWLTVGWTP